MELKQILNDEQILPVLDTEGSVLVLAGAGSGKTRVLTHRIAYLVAEKGIAPYEILAITFTNKAAREMKERIMSLVPNAEDMSISTFHSFCAKLLRIDADKLGYTSAYSIYSESDVDKVFKTIFAEMDEDDKELKDQCICEISKAKNMGLSPEEYQAKFSYVRQVKFYAEIYKRYQAELRRCNAMDFDDLLLNTLNLFREYPDILNKYATRFRYLHIDEFQDTNHIQYLLVRMLSSVHGNIFAVGDDDQSIYGWRGADITNILGFEQDFPGAKVYKLQQNYRSTPEILNTANTIIAENTDRKEKTLWTKRNSGSKIVIKDNGSDRQEADYVVSEIYNLIRYREYSPNDFVILVRVNSITRLFEEKLSLYNIPYRIYGGFKFYERKEIKDIVSYLRLVINPRDDESLIRIINFPKRGIGDATISKIRQSAIDKGTSMFDEVLDISTADYLNTSTKDKVKSFANTMLDLIKNAEIMPLVDYVKYLINLVGFNKVYNDDTEEDMSRKMNISEFVSSVIDHVKENGNCSIRDYLESVSLISDTDDNDTTPRITISTVHMVKGLEFKVVFVVGMEEGLFPISRAKDSPKELEEERRVMYVAVTRAIDRLYITWTQQRYRLGRTEYNLPSQFITCLPEFKKTVRREEPSCVNTSFTNNFGYGGYNSRSSDVDYDTSSHTITYDSKKAFTTMTSTPISKPTCDKDYSKFRAGVKVLHSKFGEGTIVATRGEGKDKVAQIAFAGLGIKTFTIQVAPITIKE